MATLERIAARTSPRLIARQLAARIETLAEELVRDAPTTRRPREWRFRRRGSLAIIVAGDDRGQFFDHESGGGGDALALAKHLRECAFAEAAEWAVRWLGAAPAPPPRPPSIPPDAEPERNRHTALAMFLAGEPNLANTPAGDYLKARGIDFAELGRQPRSLRYGAAIWCSEVGAKLPALLAAVTAPNGEHIATHRTWLAKDEADVWRKAPLQFPKKSLGHVKGGCIRLWRGISGKPLTKAPPGDTVVIGEGIETCLSVLVACPQLRCLGAVSLGNLETLKLSPTLRTLMLLKDNDTPDGTPTAALPCAAARFAAEGRTVSIAAPPVGNKDFNDVLCGAAP